MRWGFPPPIIPGSKPRIPYLTNIRRTDSPIGSGGSRSPHIAA